MTEIYVTDRNTMMLAIEIAQENLIPTTIKLENSKFEVALTGSDETKNDSP